jgi:hypothetical protein
MTGCGSGQERNSATIKAAAEVPVDVSKAKQGLDQVIVSLKVIRDANESADLKKLAGDLKGHATQVTDALAVLDASSNDEVVAGTKQSQVWHQQADGFTDPELRNASSRREGELRSAVDALSTSRMIYLTSSQAFRSELSQAISAIDLDPSQAGVRSIHPVFAKLVDDEAGVRKVLTDISDRSLAVTALLNP